MTVVNLLLSFDAVFIPSDLSRDPLNFFLLTYFLSE